MMSHKTNNKAPSIHPVLVTIGIYFMTLILMLLVLNMPGVEGYIRIHLGYSFLMNSMFTLSFIPAAIYAKNKFR